MSNTPQSTEPFTYKSIHSLIPDIYDYVLGVGEKGGLDESDAKILGKILGDIIVDRLKRNREEEASPSEFLLRMSNYGMKPRKLWYEANIPRGSGRQRTAEDKLNFLLGDIWEAIALFLAYKAGHKVEHRQKEVELEGIPGHIDVVIDGVLVDVKSATNWSYTNKFESGKIYRGDDSFGYIPQILGYKEAIGSLEAAFLVANKESGKLLLSKVPSEIAKSFDPRAAANRSKEVISLPEAPEEKCYEPVSDGESGNKVLDKNCSWCVYKFRCWQKDANNGEGLRAFRYANGVKYFTDVVKAPKVEEVTDLLNPLAMQEDEDDNQ